MTPVLSDNLQQVSDAWKTAVINNELCQLQVDIIALQETRLPESGIIRERELGSVIPPSERTEGLLKLQLQTFAGLVSLISVYAPTLTSASELKD